MSLFVVFSSLILISCQSNIRGVPCATINQMPLLQSIVYIDIKPGYPADYNDGGEELIRSYAKTRNTIAIMCGK